VKMNLLSKESLSFLNDFGNLILPGSINPFVPRWDAELPSDYFIVEVAKSRTVIEAFKNYLSAKFKKPIYELMDEDLQAIIAENSTATRDFFQSIGNCYINDFYSRPKTLSSLSLSQVPPFPRGNHPFFGNLEELEPVFKRGRMYR
jgi:hypothetical protein